MIEAVLFDLDGVLVDACEWHYEALNSALVDAGYSPISRNDHETTFNGLPTRIKLKMLNIPEDIANEINDKKQKYTLDIIKKNACVMQEKVKLHEYLKSNKTKIACVTNSIRETAIEMLKSTGQFDYIDLIISNEDVVKNKPHPDCYNLAIDKLNLNAAKCICVEDSTKGIQAAKSSLVHHLWIVSNPKDVTKDKYMKYINSIKYDIGLDDI